MRLRPFLKSNKLITPTFHNSDWRMSTIPLFESQLRITKTLKVAIENNWKERICQFVHSSCNLKARDMRYGVNITGDVIFKYKQRCLHRRRPATCARRHQVFPRPRHLPNKSIPIGPSAGGLALPILSPSLKALTSWNANKIIKAKTIKSLVNLLDIVQYENHKAQFISTKIQYSFFTIHVRID